MPNYTVEDTTTGKRITFEWSGAIPPTDSDMEEVFAQARQEPVPPTPPSVPSISLGETTVGEDMAVDPAQISRVARPIVEGAGLVGGGAVGAPMGPAGAVSGAALGYAGAKNVMDVIDEWTGAKPSPTPVERAYGSAKDILTGATMEMGGQVAGKVIGKGIEVVGRGAKQAIGRFTGSGSGAVSEAIKGGEAFTEAMRGKVSGEEIVQNAKEALQLVRDRRALVYQKQLDALPTGKDIDLAPVQMKFSQLLNRYGVKIEADGSLNMSRTALGKSGNKDIEQITEIIRGWGNQPGDRTATGLDTLKRQLDDFYSESSNARAFVASLRNTVKDTLVKEVPEYSAMMKDYSEATKLIKDMESGLMLRKQGMSGRIVADQTLRRLMSAMRDNFQLRKELLDVLGKEGGTDLSGQVAGYTMSGYMPTGLAGLPPSILGSAAALKYLNPKFLPLMAASSPRVMGEFLRMLGKGVRQMPGASGTAGRAAAYLTVPPATSSIENAYSGR